MNKLSSFFLTILITATLSFAGISDAEAKRFGGASSFGSSSKYSRSYARKSSPAQKTPSQQQAYNKNQSARQTMSKRGGLMGLLGGLALGGLLGSLFFGGAFENFNFMDILIFGGIAYLLFRLFAAKAGKSTTSAAYNRNSYDRSTHAEPLSSNYQRSNSTAPNPAAFDTDIFSRKSQQTHFDAANNDTEEKLIEDAIVLPKDFDEQEFLNGAKGAFKMLQTAWDKRDLAEIRSLTTDKVFAEIQSQLQGSNTENHTDVLKVEAELLEIREIGNDLEAVVLFDTLMREDLSAHAEQVREVWTFIKPKNSMQAKWYLDGLQQLAD
ncbi:preprotein translocase subunit Tim44 [Methyloprofundus sedimenti]|uniref:Preprotein translocase subunit Tim44 n=1 Tax=Methyloprofundus sedimenti TaxID=1420851 RepID=A0A1V8M3X2_9GAMM|nr:Tim44-like domain-containing protein [Methyloprofundus sedimenti]OQK16232.1 preprotein translocase subunit Tim44 [Methyloprofundus sedimenti]